MPTLTMQSIADLTQVRREVVSVWRTRFADTEHPFPPSLSTRDLVFEAGQLATWLEATGRGNNPDAPLEVLLHSSQFDVLLEDLEATSILLLVHDLVGGPLAAVPAGDVLAATAALDLGTLVPHDRLPDLLEKSELLRTIDALAEAAFSGRGLLDRLISSFTGPHGPWAADALTPAGTAGLVEVVRELLEQTHFRIDPHGSGGLLLATALSAVLDDGAQPRFGVGKAEAEGSVARAAMRMLAAHAGPDAVGSPDPGTPHLALHLSQRVEEPRAFFDRIESVLLDLGPQDAAVIVGPSELLVEAIDDEETREARRDLLAPPSGHLAPLRYVARLPKGLSRFGGRRRLALWVFGTGAEHAGQEWTVYGEHADTDLEQAMRATIAADVLAALEGGDHLTAHEFLRSTRLATRIFVTRPQFVTAPFTRTERSGGESLARIWDLDDGLLDGAVHLAAAEPDRTDPTVSWATLISAFAIERRGARIPEHIIGGPGPGRVEVLGAAEVRDPGRLGERAVDRLLLESTVTASTFTAPGDVVFAAEGGAAAFVDVHGGHLLEAPARSLRPRPEGRHGRVMHPHLAARDIGSQSGRDRRTWRLHTVPQETAAALDRATTLLEGRRAALRAQLATLDALDAELTHAVAAGTLAASLTPTKEN